MSLESNHYTYTSNKNLPITTLQAQYFLFSVWLNLESVICVRYLTYLLDIPGVLIRGLGQLQISEWPFVISFVESRLLLKYIQKRRTKKRVSEQSVGTTRPDTRNQSCCWDLYVVTWAGSPPFSHLTSRGKANLSVEISTHLFNSEAPKFQNRF